MPDPILSPWLPPTAGQFFWDFFATPYRLIGAFYEVPGTIQAVQEAYTAERALQATRRRTDEILSRALGVTQRREEAAAREQRIETRIEARSERIAADIETRELERQRFTLERDADRLEEQRRLAAERARDIAERDADRQALAAERDRRIQASIDERHARDLAFRIAVENRRAQEAALRASIDAARLEEQRRRNEELRAAQEARAEAIRQSFLPLRAEVLRPVRGLLAQVARSGMT